MTLNGELTPIARDVQSARNKGTSLIAVTTPDQFLTVDELRPLFVVPGDPGTPAAALQWDAARGLRALNPTGEQVLARMLKPGEDGMPVAQNTVDLAFTLDLVGSSEMVQDRRTGQTVPVPYLPPAGLVFIHNADRKMDDPVIVQALANLRDPFKRDQRNVILLAPSLTLPVALKWDVVVFDEPFPTEEQARVIVRQQFENAPSVTFKDTDEDAALDAVIGMSGYSIEQSVAMAITREGLDIPALRRRKKLIIEQTKGLEVYTGSERFSNTGGCAAVIDDLTALFRTSTLQGRRPRLIVWLDEIEKLLAGSRGDLGGVYQDAEAVLLTSMQETKAIGIMFVGVAGGGKSHIIKAVAGEFDLFCLRFDLGAMQGSLYGQSQAMIRDAVKTVQAFGGQALWMATSNDISSLKPEVLERFRFGTYFFDAPTAAEQQAILRIKMAQHGIDEQPIPDLTGYVGRNIDALCEKAKLTGRTLVETAQQIVPFGIAHKDVVERLRAQADGNWLSASEPGVYRRASSTDSTSTEQTVALGGGRKLTLN